MRDISLWIERNAGFSPDKPAIRFGGASLTYADMATRIERMAAVLAGELAIEHGDRVAWLGHNHPDFLVLLFAAARCGVMVVPLNWRLAAPEHNFILHNADVRVLFAQRDYLQALAGETLPQTCRTVDLDGPALDDLLSAAGSTPAPTGRGDDPLLLVYTSGTTGRPKGAVLTQEAIAWNAVNAIHMHDLTAHDHVLTVLPLFHVGGLNIQTTPALHLGATVTLHDRFEPGAFLAAVGAERPTLSVLVPATMAAVIGHPAFASTDLSSLRALTTGSMVVPSDLIEAFHARDVPVIQVYGSSETAPFAIYQRIERARDTVGSMGRAGLHSEIRLVDPAGEPVGPGTPGEILVRGRHVASGYWKDPETTGKAFVDGWFHTGDVAEVDPQGNYWFRDRTKNVIISGGENIYPAEIERVLREIPGIREACVVGRPDSRWGAVPVAAVVADDTMTRETVIACFDGRLARYKHPRDVIFVESLPKNALGKVIVDRVSQMVAEAGEVAR